MSSFASPSLFCPLLADPRLSCVADDYSAFSAVWTEPEGGLHGYLVRFLESQDTTFQHIAIWTLVQLLESTGASRPITPSFASRCAQR